MKVLPHEAQDQFYEGFGLFVKCVKQGHGTQVTVIENGSYEYTAKYKT